MATVKDVFQAMDLWAPFQLQMSFDNAGLLVGREQTQVKGILVALDITLPVVEEATRLGANLIVAHHPVIFDPVRALTDQSSTGALLLTLAERGIAAICAHTNLDAVEGGVNDALAQQLGLSQIQQLHRDGVDAQGRDYGIGRVGQAHASGLDCAAYAAYVKDKLGAAGVRFADARRPVQRVAVGGGACGSMLQDAVDMGCDTFVTADVKYNVFLDAVAMGINLMDAGHFATEQVVCPRISAWLRQQFPDLKVELSQVHQEVYRQV